MERQVAIERSHAETFRRARKGRRQANRATGAPVKLRIAAGLSERDLAQGAVSPDGKINQRRTLQMNARRASGGNPCPTHPKRNRKNVREGNEGADRVNNDI